MANTHPAEFGTPVATALENANLANLADAFRVMKMGTLLQGLVPVWRTYAGLTSQAAHVLNTALDGTGTNQSAIVLAACAADNSPLAQVLTGVGAGEVQIAYSTEGVPTLTFSGAVTGFQVLILTLPSDFGTALATRI